MWVRRGQDEREAHDLAAEQRERRHAVAGLPEVLDERELRVGVGPEQLRIHRDVGAGRVEVLRGQSVVALSKERNGLDAVDNLLRLDPRSGDEPDFFLRVVRDEANAGAGRAALQHFPAPLAHCVPTGGERDRQVEGDEAVTRRRVPARGSRQEDALRLDRPLGLGESARVVLALFRDRMVDRLGEGDWRFLAGRVAQCARDGDPVGGRVEFDLQRVVGDGWGGSRKGGDQHRRDEDRQETHGGKILAAVTPL